MITYLAIFFLFGCAFIVLPFGSSWYEIPKVVFSWISIFLLSFSFFWNRSVFPTKIPRSPAEFLPIAVFIFSLGSLLFFHSETAFFGNSFRLQGVLTLWSLLLFSAVSSFIRVDQKLARVGSLALILTMLFVFVAPMDQAGRAVGTLGEANSLGAFSLFLFPFALSLSVSKKRKKLLMIGVFLCTALIVFFSGSRSALIGLVAQTLFLFLYKKIEIPKAGILTVMFVIFSLFLPFADVKQTFDSRTEIWNTAWQAGLTRPLFGWGIGNVEHGLRETAKELQNPLRFQYVDSSHNVFLDWWVQGGILGLSLLSGLVLFTLKGLAKKNDSLTFCAFVGVLCVMLFNPVSIAILIPFWWCVGQGLFHKK